jgi:hypothetical protein
MVKPERRTKADVVAAAAIVLVVAAAAALIWWTSDARATVSRPAAVPAPNPTPARQVPAALRQLWSAASAATSRPVVVGGVVVTGDARQVDGRDPVTGVARWSYARDTDLCAVSWVYRYAVAVYRDDRGCGQVSTIDGSTGRRGPARSGYADKHVEVTSDGTTVLSAGRTHLEMWRSDLVRMVSYGETDARVKPSSQALHTGCTLVSAAASSSAVSVLEECPEQHDFQEPGVDAASGAQVLAVAETSTALYLPSPQPRVDIVDATGATVASTPLPRPPSQLGAVSRLGSVLTWWTGDSVLVFDAMNLTYRYTINGTGPGVPLGPAALMAGHLLVPVTDGIGVHDAFTGVNERIIPVTRPPGTSKVIPAVSGSQVFEQRGNTLVALG